MADYWEEFLTDAEEDYREACREASRRCFSKLQELAKKYDRRVSFRLDKPWESSVVSEARRIAKADYGASVSGLISDLLFIESDRGLDQQEKELLDAAYDYSYVLDDEEFALDV